MSSAWDAESISRFLEIRLPTEIVNLKIEGQKGMMGSYGIIPRLQFSFLADSQEATAFVNVFCNGVLYSGYNPLIAKDSSSPSADAVLIRAQGSIHYSRSPGVPQSIKGNRCARQGWIEEIVIDESQPDSYAVFYRLPYGANSGNPAEYYPTANYVLPLGEAFRLYATGLSESRPEDQKKSYILSYPTICLETGSLALVFDYWSFHPDKLLRYEGAAVQISIDGNSQRSAQIADSGALVAEETPVDLRDRWNYCLQDDWAVGVHPIEMVVQLRQGSTQTFEWEFEVTG